MHKTDDHKKKESDFSWKFYNVLDMAHANSEQMVFDREDYQSLLKKRECGRLSAIVGKDTNRESKKN